MTSKVSYACMTGIISIYYNLKTCCIYLAIVGDQEVKSLKVLCSKFCGWKGELRALEEHITKVCENTEVTCPNACGHSYVIVRKDLNGHILTVCPRRQVSCQQCKQTVEYEAFDQHHLNRCPKREYTCPNCNEAGCYDERTTTHLKVCPKVKIQCSKCSRKIFRCDNSTHPLTCRCEPVPCKYSEIGCNSKPPRKSLASHEEDARLHLAVATSKVLQLTKMLFLKNSITFKVTNFEEKKQKNERFYGPIFFTSKSGYKLRVCVVANGFGDGEGTHVSVFACLMKGDNDDSLTWPFTGTVTFELLNQLEDKNHHKDINTFRAEDEYSQRVMNDKEGGGWGLPQFISHTLLGHNHRNNCQYLKDDTLIFRVSAKAPDNKPWLECTS